MAIEKLDSFVKQILIYFKNKDYGEAHSLATKMVAKFPKEMISHFLLARATFWLERYPEAISEAIKAFNLAKREDLLPCAILLGSSYFQSGEYEKGYALLSKFEKEKNEEVKKLLFIFSLARKNEKEAVSHVADLFQINRQAAKKLVLKFLSS